MKCTYGCPSFGKSACCPPNTPSVAECSEFMAEYETAVILHFQKKSQPNVDWHPWASEIDKKLIELERDLFLRQYEKVFLFTMNGCALCQECKLEKENCLYPAKARPAPEAFAIDVFSMVRKHGFPIRVLTDYKQVMNRYAFLLLE